VGAERWWNGFVDAVLSLEKQPGRCALVPERVLRIRMIRHLLYHSHRIVFSMDEERKVVRVLRVYHSKRQKLRPSDIAE
jgi:plasmid stabilization system protein ParE